MLDHQVRSQDELDLITAYNATHLTPSDSHNFIKESRVVPGCALASSLIHDVATLTPPAEKIDIEWESIVRNPHAPADSQPADSVNTDRLPDEDAPAASTNLSSRQTEHSSSADVTRSCIDGAMDVLRK